MQCMYAFTFYLFTTLTTLRGTMALKDTESYGTMNPCHDIVSQMYADSAKFHAFFCIAYAKPQTNAPVTRAHTNHVSHPAFFLLGTSTHTVALLCRSYPVWGDRRVTAHSSDSDALPHFERIKTHRREIWKMAVRECPTINSSRVPQFIIQSNAAGVCHISPLVTVLGSWQDLWKIKPQANNCTGLSHAPLVRGRCTHNQSTIEKDSASDRVSWALSCGWANMYHTLFKGIPCALVIL